MRVDADRDRRPPAQRGPRVDPERRDEEVRLDGEVRRRKAERSAALVAGDDNPFELVRAAEQGGGLLDLALREQLADTTRRDAADERHVDDVDAQRSQQTDVAFASPPEAEGLGGDDRLGPHRFQDP
jgi:hypothetical protein